MAEPRTPDHDEIRRFYDDEYYADVRAREPVSWHMRLVASRLGELWRRSVLDVACGTGSWLSELADRGGSVAGIDISMRAVEAARERLPDADLRQGTAEHLPFEDRRFDLVTCMGSLEHFLDQPTALAEMHRVAKPGGQLLVLVPNAGFLTRRLGLYKGTNQVAVRETVRPLADWERMIESAGFEIVNRWRDLHTLDARWIRRGSPFAWPVRTAQALALAAWPIAWQYQVYFHARVATSI
jgi:SAM-dependent methyltransferase